MSKNESFIALTDAMRNCKICSNLPLGPRPIFQIDPAARILIAGQAPGRITYAKGVPFDDPSGDRLRDWIGLDRATFYQDPRIAILPMGFCFPGSNKNGDLSPRRECAPAWRERALAALPNLALTLVIGRYAIDWHQSALRGMPVTQAIQSARGNTIVLPHPSPRNNCWLKQNPWFADEILPDLRARVAAILLDDSRDHA